MLGVLESVRVVGSEVRWLTETHASWMAWNTLLALIPLGLALALFNPGIRRGVLWWTGGAAFLLFLPNAPYVLTDVVHLFRVIRLTDADDDLRILAIYLPVYLAFMAIGFACYVACLRRVNHYLRGEGLARWSLPVLVALQAGTAVGIYLGRVVRLNSWYVVTDPGTVVGSFETLAGRFPVAVILVTFAVLVALTALANLLWDGLTAWYRRNEDRLRTMLQS